MRACTPVVPGEFIVVRHDREEANEKSPCGKDVARATEKHLSWCRWFAGKADYLQAAHHHAGSGASEDGEEREILQINNSESRCVNGGAELAQRKLAAE